MFESFKSQQEVELAKWINQSGGQTAVLQSDEKVKDMLDKETELTSSSGTHDVVPINLGLRGGSKEGEGANKVKDFRLECRKTVEDVISGNLKMFATTFQLSFDKLNEDLTHKIHHEGDRIISYLKSGPWSRLKDDWDVIGPKDIDLLRGSKALHGHFWDDVWTPPLIKKQWYHVYDEMTWFYGNRTTQ